MIKHSILSAFAVCLWLAAPAQEERPVVLVASQGKVTYQSPSSKARQKVVAGAVLRETGSLRLKKRSSAVLFCDGRYEQLDGKNQLVIAERFPLEGSNLFSLNFENQFSNYLTAAIKLAADPDNATDAWGGVKSSSSTGDGWGSIKSSSGTGDGWGGGVKSSSSTGDGWGGVKSSSSTGDGWGGVKSSSSTGDGWGGKGQRIVAIHPLGKVLPAVTRFHWSKPASAPPFQVVIVDEHNETLLSTTTQDTFWSVDLAQHGFAVGQTYQWSVTAEGEGAARYNTLVFQIGTADEMATNLSQVERSPLYQNAPAPLPSLMRAVALERSFWLVAAADTYRQAQRAYADNELTRLMHAAFWMRQGLKEVATDAYGGR
jgi:hypothetical protein